LFVSSEPRWLGVQVQLPGEVEGARVRLTSVPYALHAEDAVTLGGRPATDYLLREHLTGWSGVAGPGSGNTAAAGGSGQAVVSGTLNFLGKFTPTGTDVGNSQVFDDGSGVGIGTMTPGAQLDVQVTTAAARNAFNTGVTLNNSTPVTGAVVSALSMQLLDASTANHLSKQSARMVYIRDAAATGGVLAFDSIFTTSAFLNADAPYQLRGANMEFPRVAAGKTLGTYIGLYLEGPQAGSGVVTNKYALLTEPGAGNVGLGTTSPASPLTVTGIIESTAGGFKFPDGTTQTTAATGGGGAGTVTSVATGTGLTGGPITNSGTIAIDTAVVPRLAVANTFTANQTINGNLTLTGTGTVTGISGVFDGSNGGVVGRDTTGASGIGVQGIASAAGATTNVGVRGSASGTNAAGVLAEATATSGTSAGIRAVSNSAAGTAGRFDNNTAGNLIEGRYFDLLFGSYQPRFRVDFNGFVYGNSFRDLQTGKNVGLAINCTSGQIMKYDGTNWACAADGGATGGGSGDVTDVLATFGGGLTVVNSGGPQPSIGLITTCATNQILKWTGFSWACANDANTSLAGATIVRTNTFLGTSAGNPSLSGNFNTAFGDNAMSGITSGNENTAFGAEALSPSSTLSRNSAFGRWAMRASTGADNTAIGNSALLNSSGSTNTAVGFNALSGSSGSDNIGIGMSAGFGAVSNNSIWIGNGVSGGGHNSIHIGNTTTNPHIATFIAGIFGQSAGGAPVMVDANGKLGITVSSQRFKEDITTIGGISRKLMQLRPVQFFYKPPYDDGSRNVQFGLVAEEVHSVFPELVIYGKDGQPDSVRYHFLAPLLLTETQRLHGEVDDLRQTVAAQAAQLAEVKGALLAIQRQQSKPTLAAARPVTP
jgi:hypothetical protein